ncbi:MAG: hypothetical protein F6K42_25335 [Leptolyngbya sp. SIO1D8]|nr:hypothetical protein [Leptolyngbya sp. SIO1D8]
MLALINPALPALAFGKPDAVVEVERSSRLSPMPMVAQSAMTGRRLLSWLSAMALVGVIKPINNVGNG